jgi:outer membrane protein assembly factor BamB
MGRSNDGSMGYSKFPRLSVALTALLCMAIAPGGPLRRASPGDWLQFDCDVDGQKPSSIITAKNVSKLRVAWHAPLPEPADGSPVLVSSVTTKSGLQNILVVNTVAGRLVAIDADNGVRLWQTTAPTGPRYTTSSPAVDPKHFYVFGYSLDGFVHRYDIRTGQEVIGPGWPALITLKGDVEKGSSNITIATARNGRTYVYMTASAYPEPGDDGDYQGHLVTIDLESGEQHVFNALCSDFDMHFTDHQDGSDCSSIQAGIWARAGAVYDSQTDRIFVTTGNGSYNADQGGYDWGSSVVALRPDGTTDNGTPLDSYTPENFQALTDEDLDLSSTTIEPLPSANTRWPRLGVQSGKDGQLRLLNLENLSGRGGPRHIGGELQILTLPQGGEVMTQPAGWLDSAGRTWVFVANNQGTTAYQLVADKNGEPKLTQRWTNDLGGTTPIVVNGVLYLAGPYRLVALRAKDGEVLWQDKSIGDIHWQSPIIMRDTLYLEDNGGYVTAYALPVAIPR